MSHAGGSDLARRLSGLLIFRAAIATALLALTLVADIGDFPLGRISPLLYGVIIGNYVAVAGLGLLLRAGVASVPVAAIYLGIALTSAFAAVQATGVVDSSLTFLYLLAILDASIVGGRRIALVTAAAAAIAYGTQLVLQIYRVLPAGREVHVPDWEFGASGVVNLSAFYLTAFLAGHLAELLRSARQAASQATEDLRAAQALQAALLEALPVGVVAIDEALVVHAANAAAAHALGTSGPLTGARLPANIADGLPPRGVTRTVEIVVDGIERSFTIVRSGQHFPPPGVLTSHNKPPALDIVVIHDRTELVALERRLAAQARLASLGELAAAIAHEIRNPLAAISGSLELLFSGDAEAENAGSLRQIVLREIERLDRLVDEFLLFARPSPLERTPLDLAALTQDVCAVFREDEHFHGHALTIDAPRRLVASLDGAQFRQVLWNLLRNALEASPPGAPVAVTLHQEREGEAIALSIRDHGPGLDGAIRAHLFEPFRTTKRHGTGLGLAVVHRIVERHGGTIELAPAPDAGTIARVVVPAA